MLNLNDIVVFLENANISTADLRKVSTLVEESEVIPELEKCLFFGEKTNYIGHFVGAGRLELLKTKAAAVHERKNLTAQT